MYLLQPRSEILSLLGDFSRGSAATPEHCGSTTAQLWTSSAWCHLLGCSLMLYTPLGKTERPPGAKRFRQVGFPKVLLINDNGDL